MTSSIEEKDEDLELTAREHVQAAAQILKAMGPERARIGWMLEDTLMYLDELDQQGAVPGGSTLDTVEKLSKLANGQSSS